MTTTPKRQSGKRDILTLEECAHFIIYRELDKLHIANPYKIATRICEELHAVVTYRPLPAKDKQRKV